MSNSHPPGLGAPIDYDSGSTDKRIDVIRRHTKLAGGRLLDVGCGNGAYTEVLAPDFDETLGIDLGEAHLAAFQQRIGRTQLAERIHLVQAPAESMPTENDYFDAAVMIEVLEHVADERETLNEIYRSLRPGGILAITVPNQAFPFETHLVKVGERVFPGRRLPGLTWIPPIHRRIADARAYTPTRLTALVRGCGFSMVAVDWVMPPFDGWEAGRKYIAPISDWMGSTPLRSFGVSIALIAQKPI